jgi:hypothetical protein
MDKVRGIRKSMREINTTLNTTRNMLQIVDEQLKDILEMETEKIVESNYSMFDDWWQANIEQTTEDVRMMSTELWARFKQTNKQCIKDMDVTTDKFKQYIKTKVSVSCMILKNKNANSAIEIKGIKWKEIENGMSVPESPQLEIVLGDTVEKLENVAKKRASKKSNDV